MACTVMPLVDGVVNSLQYQASQKATALYVTGFVAGGSPTTLDVAAIENPAAADWIALLTIAADGVYPLVPFAGPFPLAAWVPIPRFRLTAGGATGDFRVVQEQ